MSVSVSIIDVVPMGNHDSACVGLEPVWEVMAIANYDFDRAQREKLSDDEVAWLRNRPYIHEENGLAFAHGDFTRPQSWNYILSTEAVVQNFVTLRRLPFDFKNYIADMIENKVNLPDWLVALLTVATRKSRCGARRLHLI